MHPLLETVPRLQAVAVFESAGRLGSFTRAAYELGMTQPGVSRQISNLEKATGLELFSRTSNSVSLTGEGEKLLVAVQSGFDSIALSLRTLEGTGPTFLLASNPGFAQQWLLPHIDELQAVIGDADLRLRLFDRDSELGDEAYDAAIHLMPITDSPTNSRVLFEELVVPVASPGFAEANGLNGSSEASDLLEVTKLHLDGRDRSWFDWAAWFNALNVPWSSVEARMSYNNYPLVVNEAVAGRGVALAWRGLVDELLSGGSLVVVGPEVANRENAYQIVTGPSAPLEVAKRIADWLTELSGAKMTAAAR